MSMLAASATQSASTNPPEGSLLTSIIILGLSAVGLYVGWRLRIYRPSAVLGSADRTWAFAELPIWPLWVTFGAWFIGASIGATVSLAVAPKPQPASVASRPTPNPSSLTSNTQSATNPGTLPTTPVEPVVPGVQGLSAEQTATLSVLSPLISILTAGAALLLIQPRSFVAVGLLPAKSMQTGIRAGVIGALIAIPWTFIVAIGVDLVYRAINYEHPTEHNLLRAMRDLPQLLRWSAIFGAVVMAPLVEEFVFRGLIQTSLTEGVVRLRQIVDSTKPPLEPALEVSSSPIAGMIDPQVLDYERPIPTAQPRTVSRVWPSWIAILLTAALFALMHERWTQPIIFFLGVALGYVYQRTGKLWASITLHALFNGISTAIYLAQTN